MEAAGLALAVTALATSCRSLHGLARDIRDAVAEVDSLRVALADVQRLSIILQEIPEQVSLVQSYLSPNLREALAAEITSISKVLDDFTIRARTLVGGSPRRIKLRAGFGGSNQIKDLKVKLDHAQQSVDLILTLANFVVQTKVLRTLSNSAGSLSITTPLAPGERPNRSDLLCVASPENGHFGKVGLNSHEDHMPIISWKWYGSKICYDSGYWKVIWVSRRSSTRAMYGGTVLCRFPWSQILVARLFWTKNIADWLSFRILSGSGLSVYNLVSEDCEFMQACRAGDAITMEYLLRTGLAGANDCVSHYMNAMSVAINAGSLEGVKVLLSHGADVNTLLGRNQTSALEWAMSGRHLDIVRLLLAHGAATDTISALGWSTLFYVWNNSNGEPSVDFISALCATGAFYLQHQELFDCNGLGVIHYAVMYGSVEDVSLLLRLGVDPFQEATPLRWTAIQYAVSCGKRDIFEVLLPHYQSKGLSMDFKDSRGWTLLHVCAEEGHKDLAQRLITLGANPSAQTIPSTLFMAESLQGGSWTPSEIARASGNAQWQTILSAIHFCLGDAGLTSSELEVLDEEDEWFDAVED